MVSAGIPASSASTPAATAETASPRTGVPPRRPGIPGGAPIMRVLPDPAGPTTQTTRSRLWQTRRSADGLVGAQTVIDAARSPAAARRRRPLRRGGPGRAASRTRPSRAQRLPGGVPGGAVAFVGGQPVPAPQTVGHLGRQRRGQGDHLGMRRAPRRRSPRSMPGPPRPPAARPGGRRRATALATSARLQVERASANSATTSATTAGSATSSATVPPPCRQRRRQPPVRLPAGDVRLGPPPSAEGRLVVAVAGLGRAGVVGGELVLLGPLVVRQRPPQSGLRGGDPLRPSPLTSWRRLENMLDQPPGDPVDVGLAVSIDRLPLHTQPGGQLDPQVAL